MANVGHAPYVEQPQAFVEGWIAFSGTPGAAA
jgi:hypothetical protein